MKVLSVVVPMFNTELYIERCLDSLLYHKDIAKDIEIIVVNDGGSDNSLKIVKKYKKQYPNSIVIIDKENGGHGSAVNAGFAQATGRYFRVVDSDDWVDINNFKIYIEKLKDEVADVVVTDVRRQHLYDETEVNFVFNDEAKKPVPIKEIVKKVNNDEFFFEFSMHSMAVKTERLREVWEGGLLEKTFYVDQQFVAKVFMCARDYVEYNFNIYMYFIGRPEQSMGAGFFKHIEDHERVLRWLLKTTDEEGRPRYYKVIVSRQIELMLGTHYTAYIEQAKLSRKEKNDLKKFDKFLKGRYPIYYKNASVEKIYKSLSRLKNNRVAKVVNCYRKGKK